MENFIPKKKVIMTSDDKQWMSPLTKILINEKWMAFRSRNWAKYHLKQKVKVEIAKAKAIWAKKMKKSTNSVWKLNKEIKGKAGKAKK